MVATAVSTVPPYQLVGDPFRVKQIVTNLAANSVKFTSHGSVAVSWEVVQRDDSHSLVSVFVKDTVSHTCPLARSPPLIHLVLYSSRAWASRRRVGATLDAASRLVDAL